MNKIELLAPGGSIESMYAAVQTGCDAIYMGGSKFSARAYANNLSDVDLIKAVDYCHLYDVKVYIALNTLIKEVELEEALDYSRFLYKIGVDALIVQDFGLFAAIKKEMPDFELHASTQMTIHNGEGALFLKELGFKRIVLSRELSLEEIKYISTDLNIETEVFVHGALCISYSGQCLMSSVIGGRSGNRGRCAQPCRLPYTIINKITQETREGYLLSPKDTCTIDEIKAFIESNTSSLKIEGRMKKPEYVAGVVSSYRKAIDSVYSNSPFESKPHKEILTQLFNREGFSKAYLRGNIGKDMMAYNFPRNTGVLLGKVEKDLRIKLSKNISVGDGIRTDENGFIITNIIKGNEGCDVAQKGDVVQIKPVKFKAGDELYVTSDTRLLKELGNRYENIYLKKIPLELKVQFRVDEPLILETNFNGVDFKATGDIVQKVQKRPVDKDNIIKNLNKLGDTPYQINSIDFKCFEEGFIPISAINSIRRELIDNINSFKLRQYKRNVNKQVSIGENNIPKDKFKRDIPDLLICIVKKDQYNEISKFLLEVNLNSKYKSIGIAVDIYTKSNDIKLDQIDYDNLFIKVPNIIKEEFESVCSIIESNLNRIKGIVTANLGIINRFKHRTTIIGDYKLNVFNHYTNDFYSEYTDISAVSVELNSRELKEVTKKSKNSLQIVIYGKYELMVSEYCVIGSTFGGKSNNKGCTYDCGRNSFSLKDRMGEEFRVITDKFCRSHIYNNVPVNLIPHIKELRKNKINNFRVDFIDENEKEVREILQMVMDEEYIGEYKNYTRGHYKRGVE